MQYVTSEMSITVYETRRISATQLRSTIQLKSNVYIKYYFLYYKSNQIRQHRTDLETFKDGQVTD